MSVISHFSNEFEHNYQVPIKYIDELLEKGALVLISSERIEQVWIQEGVVPNMAVKQRVRIRKVTSPNKKIIYDCSYDTKYDITPTKRIELNAPLTNGEYELIKSFYPKQKVVDKTRLLLRDYATSDDYECDIYPGDPMARIEIEFDSEEEMKAFVPPRWLVEGGRNAG